MTGLVPNQMREYTQRNLMLRHLPLLAVRSVVELMEFRFKALLKAGLTNARLLEMFFVSAQILVYFLVYGM